MVKRNLGKKIKKSIKKVSKPKKVSSSKEKTLKAKKNSKKQDFLLEPLSVGYKDKSVFLLFKKILPDSQELYIISGDYDTKFDGNSKKIFLVDKKNKSEDISICSDFRFSKKGKIGVMTYLRNKESGKVLMYAESQDYKKWVIKDFVTKIKTAGVPYFAGKKNELNIYFGDHNLKVARPKRAGWEIVEPPKAPHWHFFDGVPFSIFGEIEKDEHFVVFYYATHKVDIMRDVSLRDEKVGEEKLLKIGVAIFDKNHPTRLLWQAELPIVEFKVDNHTDIKVLGFVPIKQKKSEFFRVYILETDDNVGFVDLPEDIIHDHRSRKQVLLKRWKDNPIISPTELYWEKDGTFNPTALYLGDKVHLIYRAVGADGVSSIGYASSKDGLNIDERLKKPVYTPKFWFEKYEGDKSVDEIDPLFYSGGSWGGCEDPKVTQIGDRIYMTYVAFDGSWPTRTVLTSISVDDFLNKKWRWSKPQLMSPPGVGSKSVVLMPEKINDKYYVFHRMWPNIMLDIVPDLEFGEGKKYLQGHHMITPRKSFWDSRKMSVGATPIKTKDGWLVIYNAVDRLDSSKYKIGAMLLDLKNPKKVVARSRKPILTPEEFYENDGKPGVAYPGGAIDMDGVLNVYYGGADKVSCVAQIPTDELVWHLKKDSHAELKVKKLKFRN